jgi:hypothetical protein
MPRALFFIARGVDGVHAHDLPGQFDRIEL